jgi:hypothetical protein
MRILVALIITLLLMPLQASAATFYLAASSQTLSPQGEHTIGVYIAADAPINTIAGSFDVPDGWDIEAILIAGSIVDVWIEQPAISGDQVRFAGIMPGGFSGNAGHIFSVRVTPQDTTDSTITILNPEAYLHDGLGTIDESIVVPLALIIEDSGASPEQSIAFQDQMPPEPFIPVVLRDPLLFNGDKVALFSSQDLQSGIVKYEVQETSSRIADAQAWIEAASPYHIAHQTGQVWLHVRAVDAAGNQTISSIPLESSDAWFGHKIAFAILVMLGGAVLVRLWRKKAGGK